MANDPYEDLLSTLERETVAPRQIALLRIRLLQDGGHGLAATLAPMLTETVSAFVTQWTEATTLPKENHDVLRESYMRVRRILQLHLHLVQRDPDLAEELGRQGSHGLLSKVMHFQLPKCGIEGGLVTEELQDCVMELQDMACEIAVVGQNFPLKTAPFTVSDLKARLPLVFDFAPIHITCSSPNENLKHIGDSVMVIIHQISARQSSQVDVGFGTKV